VTAFDDRRTRRAVIVAYPEDIALWFSGLLIRYHGNWNVICCSTPKNSQQFRRACGAIGAASSIIVQPPNQPFTKLDQIDFSAFDVVVTHNSFGEYGDPRHQEVFFYVANNYPTAEMYTDCYGRDSVASALKLSLTDAEWGNKLGLIKFFNDPIMFNGERMAQWQALLIQYGTPGNGYYGYDLKTESYASE
jgi:hypothetical protein